MKAQVWLITGASSGLGKAISEAALAKGHQVTATARNPEKLVFSASDTRGQLLTAQLDVTDPASVQQAVALALQQFGRIDVLVNNAGYGLFGAVEELDMEEIRRQFDTNFFGVYTVLQAVLPHMRKARSGHVFNVSSIGGFDATAGMSAYCASKFALEGLSEALAKEVQHLGIRVTIVEPGGFRTDFAGRSFRWSANTISDYDASSGVVKGNFQKAHGHQLGDPAKAAAVIVQCAAAANPPQRLVLGEDALKRMHAKLARVQTDLHAWAAHSIATKWED